MSISIIKPGLFDTIQDLGRQGCSCYGVNPGGAMDFFAAKIANALAGNQETATVLEMHFPGPQILFEKDTLISLAGADFAPTVNEDPVPCWQPVFVRKNTVLQFTRRVWGARAYLAIRGGLCADQWMGSASTHIKAKMGGFKGRKLERSDRIRFHTCVQEIDRYVKPLQNFQVLRWRPQIRPVYEQPGDIAFMEGSEWPSLSGGARHDLACQPFRISPLSDRMGYQLSGASLSLTRKEDIISSAVTYGTMQLLPNGQLILLMADHQTTGGYPKIAHVISAHLPKLAQLSAGDNIRFYPSPGERAEELLFSQRKNLSIMQRACLEQINQIL